MFKRSLFLVTIIVMLVFTSAFATQMFLTKDLPSSFDNGTTIEQAFKTSKVPLLLEFYSDSCGTCQKLTPVIHNLYQNHYKNKLTVVMMNVEDPATQQIAQLFGVDALPALYVFDHHHMKKHQIPAENFTSPTSIQKALDQALAKTLLSVR